MKLYYLLYFILFIIYIILEHYNNINIIVED